MRFRFPKSRRLLRRREFLHVQRKGKRFDVGPLLACVCLLEAGQTRVGITTSKKVGKAVFRNRIRRLIREAVRRLLLPALPERFEIVFIAKNGLPQDLSQDAVDRAIERLIELLEKRYF